MKANEQQVLAWIGLSEGGYVNHPKDPGGATDRGITQRTFDAWNKQKGRALRPVRGITKQEAEEIIVANYFAPVKFDSLPSGLDYAMADYAVNSGPARAVKELQRIVGVPADGIAGPQTLSAVKRATNSPADLRRVIIELCNRRLAFMKSLPHWSDFKNGWKRRVMGETDGVQYGDIGVIDRAVMLAKGSVSVNPVKSWPAAKAPEPETPASIERDPAAMGTVASGAGVLTALSAVLGPLGGLHPVAQGIAVAGLLLALAAAVYVMRDRVRALVRRL